MKWEGNSTGFIEVQIWKFKKKHLQKIPCYPSGQQDPRKHKDKAKGQSADYRLHWHASHFTSCFLSVELTGNPGGPGGPMGPAGPGMP